MNCPDGEAVEVRSMMRRFPRSGVRRAIAPEGQPQAIALVTEQLSLKLYHLGVWLRLG
ncbi:hypothetical protein [Fischerella sp. PCC 9605]|uniref:hypothetical protein n=1 Tax=Fischerella sp. PCC 9605 TaxID=1173024 RepID=UPI0004B8EB48|nr:hypothetical protein [Fischerella sp. PCC 9605]